MPQWLKTKENRQIIEQSKVLITVLTLYLKDRVGKGKGKAETLPMKDTEMLTLISVLEIEQSFFRGRSDVEKTKEKNHRLQLQNSSKKKPKVINLSSRDLSDQEKKLLEHGLKFTPTAMSDNVDLITDTDEFCRKLRLCEFFGNTNHKDGSLVRNKKGNNHQPNRDKH
ncbi:unnamed protein product [Mytilus coruscus]|uniref:Uncharacterized protein n=1 Tax=Mytilus coruscus TaxID=42192 RepID=A0A6J8EQ20_MYTCO|nr:unnamed protein product [Mytilus coruscus]